MSLIDVRGMSRLRVSAMYSAVPPMRDSLSSSPYTSWSLMMVSNAFP